MSTTVAPKTTAPKATPKPVASTPPQAQTEEPKPYAFYFLIGTVILSLLYFLVAALLG